MPEVEDEFDVTKINAGANVMLHIAEKGVQAGGILGALRLAVAAALRARSGGSLDAAFLAKTQGAIVKAGFWTTALSCLAGAALLGGKEGWDREKLQDRAYRLHYNEGQKRCDSFARGGAAAGSIAAVIAGSRSIHGVASGLLLGAASGTILHVLTSSSASSSQIRSAKDSAEKVAAELTR